MQRAMFLLLDVLRRCRFYAFVTLKMFDMLDADAATFCLYMPYAHYGIR